MRPLQVFRALFLLLVSTPLYAKAQSSIPQPIDPKVLAAAHSVYLAEWSPDPPVYDNAHPIYSLRFPLFEAALQASGRFKLLSTTQGADLILIMVDLSGGSFDGHSGNFLLLNARDPRTFADLGTIQVPSINAKKIPLSDSVTTLLKALFTADPNGSAFTVPAASTASISPRAMLVFEKLPFNSLITVPHEQAIAAAKKVFVSGLDMGGISYSYQTAADRFSSDLKNAGHLQLVSSVQDADLILILRGSSECIDEVEPKRLLGNSSCRATDNDLNLDVYSATTLEQLTTMYDTAKDGRAKLNKPSPFDASIDSLEHHFENVYQKEIRNVAKAQAHKK